MVQVDLSRSDGRTMTTWVDKRPDLKVGSFVSLKEGEVNLYWRIEKIYDLEVPKNKLGTRGFDNNNYDKHDGTALKKRLK